MLSKPLREYGAVSPDHSPAAAEPTETREVSGRQTAVDVRRFGWIRPLAGDYAFDFRRVAPLYAGDPTSPAAWRDAIARAQQHPRARVEIAAVMAAQQELRGAPPEARAAAARLAHADTVAVLTGQQAGAFGGPMFTLLKAITALQLAERTRRDHGVPTVAIFWVDAEDHDWEEIASCTVLDAESHARTITLPAPQRAGQLPVASLMLDGRVDDAIGELGRALGGTEFTAWVIAGLRASYRPGVGMAHAFGRWLETLLGPLGLVVFDSSDPAAKPLAADVFRRELQSVGRTAHLAAVAGQELAARGHQPQVLPQPDSVSLFYIDGARAPIRRQGEECVIGERRCSLATLLEEARRAPARFSPNVLLRPIVQDTLFPTICYVAGPSELAYLGQLKEVYGHFGLPMPLIHPRATATVVDAGTVRFLKRYGLPVEELQPQDESALNRLLASQLPASVEQALKEAQDAVRGGMERLIAAMPALDPTLAGAARTTLGRMEHDLRSLHAKMIHAAKRRDETLRRQFTRAQAQAFPLGHPQERTLAVVFFLNRYGPALVDRLLQDLPLEPGYHWVMTI